jgi:hypothetical protein
MNTSLEKIYSTKMTLIVRYLTQLWLSNVHPKNQIKIDHFRRREDSKIHFPSGVYGYTKLEPIIISYDKPVAIDSFWLRLHRSSQFLPANRELFEFKKVKISLKGIVIIEKFIMVTQ